MKDECFSPASIEHQAITTRHGQRNKRNPKDKQTEGKSTVRPSPAAACTDYVTVILLWIRPRSKTFEFFNQASSTFEMTSQK